MGTVDSSTAVDRSNGGGVDVLLVHGGWQSSGSWSRVSRVLTRRGYRVLAVDLPGHGLEARLPAAFPARDRAALGSEPSPVAVVSLDDAADAVLQGLDDLRRTPAGPRRRVVAVAHSVAGVVLTRAAQRAPTSADHLVYVGAHLPAQQPILAYAAAPEAANPVLDALYIGDPRSVGAFRLDVRSDDPDYIARLQWVFCADASEQDFLAWRETLTPDLPARFIVDPVDATADRWGSRPRTYIFTQEDRTIPPAWQHLMVDDADAMTPNNLTQRLSIPGGHTPMLTRPQDLADAVDTALRTHPSNPG